MTELNERADSLTTDSEFRLIYGLENTLSQPNNGKKSEQTELKSPPPTNCQ
jgi:hypothetical protein